MAARKHGLPLSRHQEIGAELLTMYNLLLKLSGEFSDAYPLSGPKGRAHGEIQRAIKANVQLRHYADENLFADVGGKGFDKSIYYGSSHHGSSLVDLADQPKK